MYPLLINDRTLPAAEALKAHKGQLAIEKRFQQIKTVYEIAPVFLKNEGRIKTLFTVYFLALLMQAVIERQLRLAMYEKKVEQVPMYPEERVRKHPTTEQILKVFSHAQRNLLLRDGHVVQVFPVEHTDVQKQVLALLSIAETEFNPPV